MQHEIWMIPTNGRMNHIWHLFYVLFSEIIYRFKYIYGYHISIKYFWFATWTVDFVKKFWSFSIQKSIRALYENFWNNINRKDFGKNPGTLIEFPESPSESWDLWDHMSELMNTLNILLEFEQFIHQSLIILISS